MKHGDLQYTVSNRGALQLILNRYMYNLVTRSKNGKVRRWKCVDYRNNRCLAAAVTDENVVLNREDESQPQPEPPVERLWRCVEYRHNRCPAAAITAGNVVTNRTAMHNHAFHDKRILAKIEKKAVFSALKDADETISSMDDTGPADTE